MRFPLATLALPLALLAACSDEPEEAEATGDLDPASEQALNDDLMTDPDLAGSSEGNAALSGSGDRSLPNINRTPEAIAAARTRAAELVGGADALRAVPAPRDLGAAQPVTPAMQKAAQAAVSPGGTNCESRVEYTTAWAAKLPGTFPVYPRGNTQEAAGTDEGGCALRVVSFLTPVPLNDVLAFYHTRALANGYSAEHVKAGGDNILSGTSGENAFVVYGRRLPSGVTEIDLVTSNP
jgi:hypothetical protein